MKRYGNDLQLAYAGNAYDIANLLAKTFEGAAATQSAEEIVSALRNKPPHAGVSRTFRYRLTKEGGAYFEFPIYIKQIKGEDFVRLTQTSTD